MCGIAGFTIAPGIGLERTALARLLLAGIAERGTDATGYGYHRPDGAVEVHKESMRLREFVEQVDVPEAAGEAIFHVRGYTKGVPSVNDNNHPVRYGRAVVVHNGHLDNDDELFRRHRAPRSTPHITVDSEAIAMLADRSGDIAATLAEVRGSAAVRVLWDGEPGRLTLAGAPRGRCASATAKGSCCSPRRRSRSSSRRGRPDAACASRRSRRAARSSCTKAASSRAAASRSTKRYVGVQVGTTHRWPRSPRCSASLCPPSKS